MNRSIISSMSKQSMQFLYGDRELLIQVADLFTAPVDVIVNPANAGLSHGGGVAALMVERGGKIIQQQSDQFIEEHGQLESGLVAYTSAGSLPYDAVLHAVGPRMGEGDEQEKLKKAVANCLRLCHMHDWHAIAFPAISAGIFAVPIEIVAQAFFRGITSFWDARADGAPEKIIICLTEEHFDAFVHAFREDSMLPESPELAVQEGTEVVDEEKPIEVGVVDLNEEDISGLEDDEVNDWFK